MRPSTLESLQQQREDWIAHQQEDDGLLSIVAQEVIEKLEWKISTLISLLDAAQGDLIGLTLKHPTDERWGMILPDASSPGRYRWQGFRADGFTGHCTFDSAELCLGDMIDSNLEVPDPGALDRLAATSTWKRGSEILSLVHACNAGLISWDEANAQAEVIKQKYQEAA